MINDNPDYAADIQAFHNCPECGEKNQVRVRHYQDFTEEFFVECQCCQLVYEVELTVTAKDF